MNNTMKQYILNNWNAYDIVDSIEEMLVLLNILEAHKENLDSLHDVPYQGYTEFCGIVGTYEDDRDVVSALFEHDVFYETMEDLHRVIMEDIECSYNDGEMTLEEYLETEDIRKTSDGYVRVLWY